MPNWLFIAAAVIAADQATKAWIAAAFRLGESLEVTPFFNLVFIFNPGAAFSFLADGGGWQRWFFVGLALAISAWLVAMLRRHAQDRLLSVALSLILGGALGNAIDRLRFGAVVDFLHFHAGGHHFPAFNLADSAINIGVALFVWHQFIQKEHP